VKYADGLVILAKGERLLQGLIAKLSEIGRCFGMEMNMEKLRTISRKTSLIQTMIDEKRPANLEHFNYLGSMITNYARCTCEIKSRIAKAKAVLNKIKALFTRKLDLNLRQKIVKCYIGSTSMYGAEK
jgi:hypothetical protein